MYSKFKEIWEKQKFSEPTEIQTKSYDIIQSGKDLVGISPTGTGKTLAYILPLLEKITLNDALQCIVLVPSQELAQQIAQVWRLWGKARVQAITGGANLRRQLEQLKNKPNIIVATPGRLLEIANQSKKIKFHQVETIVLDEADYLLHPEHLNSIRELIKKAPSQRQLMFFSATTNETLQNVEKWFNVKPEYVTCAEQKNDTLHGYIIVEDRKRTEYLRRLAHTQDMHALVFVQHVESLVQIYEKLVYENISVAVLHSHIHHTERKKALDMLKNREITYLLTTDIATRGIDIDSLPVVIQYDVPREIEIYKHRSGRTGRMGKSGSVITLVSKANVKEYLKFVDKAEELDVVSGEIVTKQNDRRK